MNDRVEVVRQGYATAAQVGYLDTDWGWFFDEVATDDLEFRPATGYVDAREVYRGREGWIEAWELQTQVWQSWALELEDVREVRDGVVLAVVRLVAVGHESGVTADRREGHVFWFRGDRICRFVGFADPADAYRELGLSM